MTDSKNETRYERSNSGAGPFIYAYADTESGKPCVSFVSGSKSDSIQLAKNLGIGTNYSLKKLKGSDDYRLRISASHSSIAVTKAAGFKYVSTPDIRELFRHLRGEATAQKGLEFIGQFNFDRQYNTGFIMNINLNSTNKLDADNAVKALNLQGDNYKSVAVKDKSGDIKYRRIKVADTQLDKVLDFAINNNLLTSEKAMSEIHNYDDRRFEDLQTKVWKLYSKASEIKSEKVKDTVRGEIQKITEYFDSISKNDGLEGNRFALGLSFANKILTYMKDDGNISAKRTWLPGSKKINSFIEERNKFFDKHSDAVKFSRSLSKKYVKDYDVLLKDSRKNLEEPGKEPEPEKETKAKAR